MGIMHVNAAPGWMRVLVAIGLRVCADVALSLLILGGVAEAAQAADAVSPGELLAGYWAAPPPTPEQLRSATLESPHRDFEALLQPWALAQYEKFKELNAMDVEVPTPDNNCLPYAIPGAIATYGFPMEFLITPKLVVMLFQLDSQMRVIYMGASHPAKVPLSWDGDSVGHWEAKTLVIDSVGFNDRSEYGQGMPHTDKLHITERYTPSDDGKTVSATYIYDDPGALTGTYTQAIKYFKTQHFQEFVNGEQNLEFACPTAEAGSAYQKRTLANLEGLIEKARQKDADAKARAAARDHAN
jgi:hypothetical protein